VTHLSVHVTALLFMAGCAASEEASITVRTESLQVSQDRKGRSPAQAKLDARLRAALERARAPQADTPQRRTGTLDIDRDGKVLVDIQAPVTTELIAAIAGLDGVVILRFPAYESIRARVPLLKLETLAERSDVKFIRTAEQAITNPGASEVR